MPSAKDRKCRLCPKVVARENATGLCRECYVAERRAAVPSERVAADRERTRTATEMQGLRVKYAEALKTIERQETPSDGWTRSAVASTPRSRSSRAKAAARLRRRRCWSAATGTRKRSSSRLRSAA
jgi:NMD protein affecting ribosome stability and mRNA decay